MYVPGIKRKKNELWQWQHKHKLVTLLFYLPLQHISSNKTSASLALQHHLPVKQQHLCKATLFLFKIPQSSKKSTDQESIFHKRPNCDGATACSFGDVGKNVTTYKQTREHPLCWVSDLCKTPKYQENSTRLSLIGKLFPIFNKSHLLHTDSREKLFLQSLQEI